MPNVALFKQDGSQIGEVTLNEEIFGIEPNESVVYDAIIMQRASLRQGTHAVKNRSAVRGGGRKPWRQKGTGRARQGSIRSPQWRGGGIVFGPKPRSYKYNLNRKVRRLAVRSALSQHVIDSTMKVVADLTFENVKTKEFAKVMSTLELNRKTLFIVADEEDVINAYLSMRNLPNTMLLTVQDLNTYDIVNADTLVFTAKAAEVAGEVLA